MVDGLRDAVSLVQLGSNSRSGEDHSKREKCLADQWLRPSRVAANVTASVQLASGIVSAHILVAGEHQTCDEDSVDVFRTGRLQEVLSGAQSSMIVLVCIPLVAQSNVWILPRF